MNTNTKITAITLASALAVLAGANSATAAEVAEPIKGYDEVVFDGPEMFAAPGSGTSNRPTEAEPGEISPQAVTTGACTSGPISNSGRTDANGSYVEVGFNSNVTWSGFGCFTGSFDGTSYAKWAGSGTATSLSLHDEFSSAGVGVSVSIPAGASGSITGGLIVWDGSNTNTRQITHTFSGYNFSGAVISVTESASMTAQFGDAFFTANA